MLKILGALMPNPEQFGSFSRTLVQVGSTYVGTISWMDGNLYQALASAAVLVATTGYGSFYKRTQAQLQASADKVAG